MLEDPTLMLRGLINNAPSLYLRLTLNRLIDYIVEDSELGAVYNPETDELEFDEGSDASSLSMWDIMEILAQGLLTGGEVDLHPQRQQDNVDRVASSPPTPEEIEKLVKGFTESLGLNEEKEN